MTSVFDNIDFDAIVPVIPDEHIDTLSEIMSLHKSDKGWGLCSDYKFRNVLPPNEVCHNYTYFYHNMFNMYRSEPLHIFEMGVGVPSCMGSWAGSLKAWKQYFPKSEIYSADIDKSHLYQDERITSYYVDQEDGDSIMSMWKLMDDKNFDIIIDDGPHTYSSNILFYKKSIHKLKIKGVYIIEDVNLHFIDELLYEIKSFNEEHGIHARIKKLEIPWPKNFHNSYPNIMDMNNLIFLQT
jgi:hypothetical protein